MVFEGKWNGNFEKDQESNSESNVSCKADEEKEDRGPHEMLGLKETVVQMAKVNGVRWYGHVLRRDVGHVLRKAFTLEFEVKGKRKQEWPKKTWKMKDGEWEIAVRVGEIRPPTFTGINPDQNWIDWLIACVIFDSWTSNMSYLDTQLSFLHQSINWLKTEHSSC